VLAPLINLLTTPGFSTVAIRGGLFTPNKEEPAVVTAPPSAYSQPGGNAGCGEPIIGESQGMHPPTGTLPASILTVIRHVRSIRL
jgi:hypothetical protein